MDALTCFFYTTKQELKNVIKNRAWQKILTCLSGQLNSFIIKPVLTFYGTWLVYGRPRVVDQLLAGYPTLYIYGFESLESRKSRVSKVESFKSRESRKSRVSKVESRESRKSRVTFNLEIRDSDRLQSRKCPIYQKPRFRPASVSRIFDISKIENRDSDYLQSRTFSRSQD